MSSRQVSPPRVGLSQAEPLSHESASRIAERLVDLSAFIYKSYCTGIIAPDLPSFATMKHLSGRLYSYAFGLVVQRTPGFLTRPGQDTSLNTSRALQSMGQLTAFMESKAHDLNACGLANGTELALAQELKFVEKYTDMLLEMGPDSFVAVESSTVADEAVVEAPDPMPAPPTKIDDSTDASEPKPISDKAQGKMRAIESPTGASNVVQDASFSEDVVFKYTIAEPIVAHLLKSDRAEPESQAPHGQPHDANIDTQTYLDLPARPDSGDMTPAGATTPNDLRPTPHNAEHVQHPLQGSRLKSRSGVADYEAFAKLHAQSDKGLIRITDPCITTQVGHSTGEACQIEQYLDASPLGRPGVKVLRLVHPFCAREIQEMDFDALRYIDLMFGKRELPKRFMNTDKPTPEQETAAIHAVEESRGIVDREIGIRNWQIERAAKHATGSNPPADEVEDVFSEHSWPGHEDRAAEALRKSMEGVSPPSSIVSFEDSAEPRVSASGSSSRESSLPSHLRRRRRHRTQPRSNHPGHYSLEVTVPRDAKGPSEIKVTFPDGLPAMIHTNPHLPARTATGHPSTESGGTVPSETLRAPDNTQVYTHRLNEAAASAARPDTVRTAGESHIGGQLDPLREPRPCGPPVLELRDRGPSTVQLQAQLTALQQQMANAGPRDNSQPQISVNVPTAERNLPESWPETSLVVPALESYIPKSPLQGSASSMQGPHEDCECVFAPCASEHEAEVVVVESAVAEPVMENPVTKGPIFDAPALEEDVIDHLAPHEPVAETSVVDIPVAEKPVAEKPVAETSVAETSVVETPVAETSVAETSTVDMLVAETSVVYTPVATEQPESEVVAIDTAPRHVSTPQTTTELSILRAQSRSEAPAPAHAETWRWNGEKRLYEPSEPVGNTITSYPNRSHAGPQAEVWQWNEDKHLFEGRSTPPSVAHINTLTGKKYILDTPDGQPLALDGPSTLHLPNPALIDPDHDLGSRCHSPTCDADTPGVCYSNTCRHCAAQLRHMGPAQAASMAAATPTNTPHKAADAFAPFVYRNSSDGHLYVLYHPDDSPLLYPEHARRRVHPKHAPSDFPFLGPEPRNKRLRTSRGRARIARHGVSGLIQKGVELQCLTRSEAGRRPSRKREVAGWAGV